MTDPAHLYTPPGDHDGLLAELACRMRPEPWRPHYDEVRARGEWVPATLHGPRREQATRVLVLDATVRDGCVVVLVEGEAAARRVHVDRVPGVAR